MGIIKAAINAVTGALADTWLEVIESSPMGKNDVIVPGQAVDQRGRSQNKKGGENLVSNGSIIHVLDNQMMILVDGGKIVDYSATPGYFKVENSSLPSMFNGQLKENIKESFSRIKYAGISSTSQRVFFINLQEIRDLQFGTQNPVQYFDEFYEAELFMRLHGTFSVKITDPFKFYMEVIPKEVITNNESYAFNRQNMQQFFDEFVAALSAAFNQYSADGNRISHITSKGPQMAKYMQDVLDADWTELRGLEQQDGFPGQLPQGRCKSAGVHGEVRRRGHQCSRQQRRRRGSRLHGHEHGSEYGRRRNGRLYAESPVRAAASAGSSGSAAASTGSPAGRLDM